MSVPSTKEAVPPDPHAGTAGRGYIPTLDGWRAVAIVAVIASHAKASLVRLGLPAPVVLAADRGRFGVELFFAISGLLICNRLLAEHRDRGRISLTGFYTRRLFRVLPLYYAYLVTIAALASFARLPVTRVDFTSCVFFYINYLGVVGPYVSHFWSLSVEEHFYLLWPLILVVLGPARAPRVVPALAFAVTLWREYYFATHSATFFPETLVRFRTDFRIDALLWGCYAALLTFDRRIRVPAWSPWAILAGLIVTILVKPPGLYLFLGVLFPALLVSTIARPDGFLGRLLEWPAIRWVGRLSYSLYVWHVLFTSEPEGYGPRWLVAIRASPPLSLVSIVAVAAASYYLIERPLVRVGHRLSARRRAAPAAGAPGRGAVGGFAAGLGAR